MVPCRAVPSDAFRYYYPLSRVLCLPLSSGLMAKALARGIAEVVLTNPRDFSTDKHQRVDDEPYGGCGHGDEA